MKFSLQSVMKFVMLEEFVSKTKSDGLPEFASSPPLGGGLDENSGRP
jgi:hypothetical protein